MRIDACADKRVDSAAEDMCADICMHMRADMWAYMCTDMSVEMYLLHGAVEERPSSNTAFIGAGVTPLMTNA